MDPLAGISRVATGGCASAWCGVFAGRSIGARSRTSVPARASRKMRALFASAKDLVAGESPAATTRTRVSNMRLIMARGIVTTLRGPWQRTRRRPKPSHSREHHGRLLLVDEVARAGYAVHDEHRQQGGQDRHFIRADAALVRRRPEEQTDRAPHLSEMRAQPLRSAPLGHRKKRSERRVQVVRGARRITVD